MATTEPVVPVNGNYTPHGYDNYTATGANSASAYEAAQPPTTSNQANTSASTSEIPKDEVGWYFVEQYYTTLSKNPERLYLYYNKRSQFVSGEEEAKVQVCIGQKAINDRIKELDFHDTKVRVTNVDSQGSDSNIVIQVIGEISNRGQPHKRFVQTFVLAAQTNGYFVLNDIFRYLAEEPEEEEEQLQSAPVSGIVEPAPTAAVPEAEFINQSHEIATSEEDLDQVDQKLEDVAEEMPSQEAVAAPVAAINGTPVLEEAEITKAEEAPAAAVSTEETSSKEPEEIPTEAEALVPEKSKDPSPTPISAPPKPAPAAVVPSKPAAPRNWASIAASANKVAMPAVPAPATPQTSSQVKTAVPTPNQPALVPAAQIPAPARESSPVNSQGDASGWQTATGHKKEQSRAQNQAPGTDADNKRAYIKNVYSQVEEGALKSVLSKFGDIEYLDISRQKNCAFVDFKTAAGFQNAVNSNPHTVNGLDIKVEERRLRPTSFTPYPRGAPRGRGNIGGQGRGGFQPRGGRGGSVGRGGRAAPQEA